MPTPNKGESQADFVSRYTGDPEAVKSNPDPKQRVAIAYSIYAQHHKGVKKMGLQIDLAGEVMLKAEEPPKPYGKVEYADPAEGKYPIDTEEHIRAAWNYVNKPKNATILGEKAASTRAKIIAAWKKKIDPKGPPSAQK